MPKNPLHNEHTYKPQIPPQNTKQGRRQIFFLNGNKTTITASITAKAIRYESKFIICPHASENNAPALSKKLYGFSCFWISATFSRAAVFSPLFSS